MKNTAFQDPNAMYYAQEKRFLFHLIPDGPNTVMDLGCATGRVGRALMESKKAAEVYGVELFEAAAEEAKKYYKQVHVGDIEDLDLSYDSKFDIIICGDILEHLKNPVEVVRRIRAWLKPEGRLVCCVPNIRNFHVIRKLILRGDWEYEPEGIMDHTHLRFFTSRSFKRMLADASFIVTEEGARILGPKQHLFNRLTFRKFEGLLAFQIFFSARKK